MITGASVLRVVGTSIDVIKFHNNNKRHSHGNRCEMQSRIEVRASWHRVDGYNSLFARPHYHSMAVISHQTATITNQMCRTEAGL